jgi:hypothetical protein
MDWLKRRLGIWPERIVADSGLVMTLGPIDAHLREYRDRLRRLGPERAEAAIRERNYRRGYLDGWVAAIDSLYGLIEERAPGRRVPAGVGAAYPEAWDYWHGGPLWQWAKQPAPDGAPLPLVPPPSPPQRWQTASGAEPGDPPPEEP